VYLAKCASRQAERPDTLTHLKPFTILPWPDGKNCPLKWIAIWGRGGHYSP